MKFLWSYRKGMHVVIAVFLYISSSSASCISGLVPNGHIQVNIHPVYTGEEGGPLVDLNANTFSLFNDCLAGFIPPPKTYLLIINDPTELEEVVHRTSCNHHRWWPWVWTVVLLRSGSLTSSESELFSREAIQLLWTKAVYNCAVYIEKNNVVYKADPFAKGNKCGTEAVNVYRGNCSHSPIPYRSTFPKWCDLQVSARDTFPFSILTKKGYRGYDVKLATLIATRSNLNIRWSTRPSQQTSTHSVAHAYYENFSRNELDLAIGGSVLSHTYFKNVSYAYSHATQYLYFYVADGVELRGWQRLFAMFSGSIWLYILLTVFCTILVLTLFGKGFTSEYFLIVLGLLLEKTVKLPQGRLRIVLMCVVFPFYYISSMYTTILHSYTMNPPSSTGINSLDELLSANLTVVLSDTNKLLTDQVSSSKVREVLRNSWPSPGMKEAARLLHKERNFCLCERDIEINVVIARNGFTIHHIDYKVATIRNALVHPKGSKYARRIHEIISRSIESGLLNKWKKDEIGKKASKPSSLNLRPISWHDVDSAFMLFFIGHAAATVSLLTEIFIHKLTSQTDDKYSCITDIFY